MSTEEDQKIRRLWKNYQETGSQDAADACLYLLTRWLFRQFDERSAIDGKDYDKAFFIALAEDLKKQQEVSE